MTARSTVLVATRSEHKQREIRMILPDFPYLIVFPDDVGLYRTGAEETIETAETFVGNARRKAEHFARLSGLPTVSDDSGLEVYALGGQPGVRSRRFTLPADDQDAANNAELRRRLAGAPRDRRVAAYRCAVVFQRRAGAEAVTFEGTCPGRILDGAAGSGGFGYDPLFFSEELGRTLGEVAPEQKHRVSHRGRAFRAFAEWLAGNPL